MNNLTKFIKLLQSLIEHIAELKTEVPFGNPSNLENALRRELHKAIEINKQNAGEYKYEYFSGEVLHTKSPNGEMYEYLGGRNSEIKNIQYQIDKLILPEIRSKHLAMKSEFEKLRNSANSKLPEIGYNQSKEENFSSEFKKENGLKIKVVDQRYDPPECWISQNDAQQFTRIGFISEYYFDRELKIIKKYNDPIKGFDHSSMNYYLEFLDNYESKLLEIGDFVSEINEWAKNNYLEIEQIKNAI
jgi:hypothetical protein